VNRWLLLILILLLLLYFPRIMVIIMWTFLVFVWG
jgi:hypothetical protein